MHCERSWHGLTYGSLSLNGDDTFREGFGRLLPGCECIPFNDLEALERALHAKDVAAFFVEPIVGHGVFVPDDGYVSEAARRCRKYGTLFVADVVAACHRVPGAVWDLGKTLVRHAVRGKLASMRRG